MSKLHKQYKPFGAQNLKWRFDIYFNGTDESPIYRIVLVRWIEPNPEEVALVNAISGEMAHAFIENDAVVNAYIDTLTSAIQAGALKP